jgi:acetoin utilization protein AcuC
MKLVVAKGPELYLYSFPNHPFNNERLGPFYDGLPKKVETVKPALATEDEIKLFHEPEYIELVKRLSKIGSGLLDKGDTPAFKGCYEASLWSSGTTLNLTKEILDGKFEHAFNPTGGLHHATPSSAAGFCIFNDIGIAINYLLGKKLKIAYVDTDAHHGDGVYYAFESEPSVVIADIHQDPRTLYPRTGFQYEKGTGPAEGTKLNLPLAPGAGDTEFRIAFNTIIKFLSGFNLDFIIWQAGADCMDGDPLTQLRYSPESYKYAANKLHKLAHEKCNGKLLVLGGGGYNAASTAAAWLEAIKVLNSA